MQLSEMHGTGSVNFDLIQHKIQLIKLMLLFLSFRFSWFNAPFTPPTLIFTAK